MAESLSHSSRYALYNSEVKLELLYLQGIRFPLCDSSVNFNFGYGAHHREMHINFEGYSFETIKINLLGKLVFSFRLFFCFVQFEFIFEFIRSKLNRFQRQIYLKIEIN